MELEPNPCPFCHSTIDPLGEESFYFNGMGPPPCFAVRCDTCGARGPFGYGKRRKDQEGARQDAIRLWNAGSTNDAKGITDPTEGGES